MHRIADLVHNGTFWVWVVAVVIVAIVVLGPRFVEWLVKDKPNPEPDPEPPKDERKPLFYSGAIVTHKVSRDRYIVTGWYKGAIGTDGERPLFWEYQCRSRSLALHKFYGFELEKSDRDVPL